LLYLRQYSRLAAWSYWQAAMNVCRVMSVEPSLLLHPLDFLGGDEEPELGFFPAMSMTGAVKREFVSELLADFSRRFRVVSLDDYAAIVAQRKDLRTVDPAAVRSGEQEVSAPRSALRAPRLVETALDAETIRQ
jgi:peptidoglycan-N-acetylglucosamine deacetylase